MPVLCRLRAIRPNCRAPSAGYLSATANKAGGEDRTFNCLNGAYGNLFSEIEIHGADPGLCRRAHLGLDLLRSLELLLNRSMQPPLTAPLNKRGTSRFGPVRQF